jgi:arsenate reductase-like glutaredoxin family protein
MIREYRNNGNSQATRKVEVWLESHSLSYEVITYKNLTVKDLQHILSLTNNGFEEIMVSRHRAPKLYSSFDFNFDTATTEEIFNFLFKHQKLLKSPIVFNNQHLCVGYNLDSLYPFLPKKRKNKLRTGWYGGI